MNRSLHYYNTTIDVQLGDRVEVKKGWFGKRSKGVVCYLPGVSQPLSEMECEGASRWAIALEDATVLAWLFVPERLQPTKSIQFISRGDLGHWNLHPTDALQ